MTRYLAGFLIAAHATIASAGILDSAVRFWSFDQTLTESRVGTGAAGSIGALPYVTDRDGNAGGALDLGGSTDAVVVDNTDPIALSDFTISLWFRMDEHNPNGGRSTLFDTRRAGVSYPFSAGNASVIGFLDNGVSESSGPNPTDAWFGSFSGQDLLLDDANDGNWHNLLLTVDGTTGTQSLYFDGSVRDVRAANPGPDPSVFALDMTFGDSGRFLNSPGFNFRGALDDVAIWGTALDATQVEQVYLAAASATPAIVSAPGPLLLMSASLLFLGGRRRQI